MIFKSTSESFRQQNFCLTVLRDDKISNKVVSSRGMLLFLSENWREKRKTTVSLAAFFGFRQRKSIWKMRGLLQEHTKQLTT